MSALEIIACTSAEDLLSRLRRSNDRWWSGSDSSCSWVFRGIGDADTWRLIPSAWRASRNKLEPLLKRVVAANLNVTTDDGPGGVFRAYREWHAAEQEALFQFASLANEVGFPIDADCYARERSPLASGLAPLIRGEGIFPNVELMAQAQHHGVPTRLLDWSGSPVIAAFFAASPLYRHDSSQRVCVWALNTSQTVNPGGSLRAFGRFRIHVHAPARARNPFLHSQGGVLTELLGAEDYFYRHGCWPALEDVFERTDAEEPVLIGHTLESSQIARLLTLLDREGVNSAVLMPTLDNVAKAVMARWEADI